MGCIYVPLAAAAGLAGNQPQPPRRYMAYVASFSRKHTLRQVYEFLTMRLRISREDMRLWKFKDEVSSLAASPDYDDTLNYSSLFHVIAWH